MIAASVFKDPDHDISWLKPYWWVRQSFSHMLGSSEYTGLTLLSQAIALHLG